MAEIDSVTTEIQWNLYSLKACFTRNVVCSRASCSGHCMLADYSYLCQAPEAALSYSLFSVT